MEFEKVREPKKEEKAEKLEKSKTLTYDKYEPMSVGDKDSQPYAEVIPATMNMDILQTNLGRCLNIIEDEVMKGYVTKLNKLPIISPHGYIKEDKDMGEIHFFRISELVYQEDEFSVDKLAMVFHALSNSPCTLVLMLKSDGEIADFYLGARPAGGKSAGTLLEMLKQSMLGFFPGSRIDNYYDEDMKKNLDSLEIGCISCVTCIADYKKNENSLSNKDFIQGLEKFVYTMQGKSYTAIFIADNVKHDDLMLRKHEYEQIYTQISPFSNMQMSFTVSDGKSSSEGHSEGMTKGTAHTDSRGTSKSDVEAVTHIEGRNQITNATDNTTETTAESDTVADGKTHTQGTSDGVSKTVINSANVGVNIGNGMAGATVGYSRSCANGISHSDSVSDSVSKTLSHGISSSRSYSHSNSKSIGTNESDGVSSSSAEGSNEGHSDTVSETFNLVNTKTMTDTFGTSRGVTLNAKNMTLNLVLQKIEKHLERIGECESFGMWNFAAYFLGGTLAETETAANIYKSIIAGTDSGIERSAINSWTDKEDKEMVATLAEYIKKFVHPQFFYRGFSFDEERYIAVNPAALVSTNELAIHMGLPRHSVKGLPVVEHTPFAQEVITRCQSDGGKIKLGNIYNLGQESQTGMELDINSLTMHTFITGSTGSGKSNTVYKLLNELEKKEISFLVIEPAKGEYKDVLGKYKDVNVFGTNPNLRNIHMLRINPFRFPEHTHILEHLDRLIEIFNVCWPMYAAMPAILKESIERAYIKCGWNLEKSINKYDSELFPSFNDIVKQIKAVLNESDYSDDNKGDYTGSLVTRLRSLTNGINGLIFTTDDIDDDELFDKNAIVDLSRVGSTETKSLLMGLLVLKLQEYRMEQRSKGSNLNASLKHITVLEEAHNLLKKTSIEQTSEGSNMLGKSVEMLSNSIAEMRTYGEGFVIADQSPGLLDMSVIRNTNTKIILRLPDLSDRQLVGRAAGLSESQIAELTKLERGVAAIFQNDWIEPVLCKIYRYNDSDLSMLSGEEDKTIAPSLDEEEISCSLLEHIMNSEIYRKGEKVNIRKLKQGILKSKLETSVKCDFIEYINAEKGNAIKFLRMFIYDFLNADKAIEASRNCKNIYEWVNSVADKLNPSITGYSQKQVDLVMALLIYEKTIRDASYNDILCKFTETYKQKGGVC